MRSWDPPFDAELNVVSENGQDEDQLYTRYQVITSNVHDILSDLSPIKELNHNSKMTSPQGLLASMQGLH